MAELPLETVQRTLLDLVRAPRADLRVSLEKYLRAAAEGLNAERAGLWYFSAGKRAISEAYRYGVTGQKFIAPGTHIEAGDHPRWFSALTAGGIVAVDDAWRDVRAAELIESHMKPQGIRALLDVPIWRSGELSGILCVEHVGEPHQWSQEEQLFASSIASMITLAIEIDARRKAERSALARESELKTILDHVVDIVTIIDVRGEVVFFNKAGKLAAGLPESEPVTDFSRVIGHVEVLTADGRPAEVADFPLMRALQGTTVIDGAVNTVDRNTGKRTFTLSNAAPFYGAAGEIAGAVAITRDVTAHIELENMKAQLLRVSAHELRTPVVIIKGYAQLMQRRIEEGKPIDPALVQAVAEGGDRLARLVDDLLDAMRYQGEINKMRFEFTLVDVGAVVSEATRDLGVSSKRHRFAVRAAAGLAVKADEHRIRQAVLILLDNAMKYSPSTDEIEVEVRREGASIVAEVSDRGIGIPPDKRDRIFDVFYRAHADTPNDFGGLGVGLYLARQIIQRHGGEIGYTPRQPGSTFWIKLPAA